MSENSPTVGMISLGCSKNQVDAERMLASLAGADIKISPRLGDCDALIINTCGFIEDAKKEGIQTVLEFAAQKGQGKLRGIIVTGCLPERYRQEFADEFPEVDAVLGIGSNSDIVSAVRSALEGNRLISFGEKEALPLEGGRILANAPYFAYLKIAEGCDNRCTYCAIPEIRGRFRSRKMENIVEEAKTLVSSGVRELNVVAQDTTRYGEDIYGRLMLPELLDRLSGIDGLCWLRVLYCYPDRVTDELLFAMRDNPKITRYMDLPVQHASGRILKAMNRRGNAESLRKLAAHIREAVPGVVLRTTLITGFPGETEGDFETLCGLVRDIRFERLGCFAYSREEGTPAADLPNQIDDDTKHRRAEIIMELQAEVQQSYARSMKGKETEVLCEGYDQSEKLWYGRGEADAPDIDTRVYFSAQKPPKPGDFVKVRVTGARDCDLEAVTAGGSDESSQ